MRPVSLIGLRGARALRTVFCTGIHRFPQVADQKTLANFSRPTYYAHQIDREEKLLESIQRGGKDKTWSASTELNREESSAVR